MRFVVLFVMSVCLALPAWGGLVAQSPGTPAERVQRVSQIDEGHGAVVLSIRSELYLDEPLDVFFLREGGDVENSADVVRFSRRQNPLSFGNSTVKYKVRVYQLPAGKYRLIAHGMDCPKIPAENERCLVDIQMLGETVVQSRPSRGYPEEAPVFEVRQGQITNAGDFALTARNTIEWSGIPSDELRKVRRSFSKVAQGPSPLVPESFNLKYGLFPRSFETDRRRRY